MISASAIWNSSPRLLNAHTRNDLLSLLIFCFFCLGSLAEGDAMALPKKLEYLNSLRVFDRLLFSLSLHYCNDNFHILKSGAARIG